MTLDRMPERSMQGQFIALDTCVPHFLTLRRYSAEKGVPGGPFGELRLRLPSFITGKVLKELAGLYRRLTNGDLHAIALKERLAELHARTPSPEAKELIQSLSDALRVEDKGVVPPSHSPTNSPKTSGNIYFRLKGEN
ncbi:unnamed protein product [Phytomonas sp. Hart1]|nr:unnamed protein product [Phytomonas sp. Hart1]|eukprot:CCW68078.1 unnamed protein product [Phytomonas sp. isolate Hart1]